jgi:integrase
MLYNQVESEPLAIRRPQQQDFKYKDEILKTITKAKTEGKAENTLRSFYFRLKQLSKVSDLMKPEDVKQAIAYAKLTNSSKVSFTLAYDWFCKTNGIEWKRPYFKWERKIPLIPTTENINKIISASTSKYATIFTILAETGLEAHELATTQRKNIDTEQGIINVQGCKGHNSRSLKLSLKTADLLRTYLYKYKGDKPFPSSKNMGTIWQRVRKRVADKLNEPQLKLIPLRNLRHHYATKTYDKTRDILLVMQKLGHKKIGITMLYTQLLTFNEEEEYTCKTATNIKEATELLEHGFEYIQEIDGIKPYRKRK